MKYVFLFSFLFYLEFSYAGKCDYPDQLDSAGRRCGGRAASVRPGGRLGGDGSYTDSQGRERVYGRGNDPYDRDNPSPSLNNPLQKRQDNNNNNLRSF